MISSKGVSKHMTFSVLQELVDAPNETLGVEYKSWLDFNSNEVRADVARHIAAVANHGGGYIVFGFDDATLRMCPIHLPARSTETSSRRSSRDTLNQPFNVMCRWYFRALAMSIQL